MDLRGNRRWGPVLRYHLPMASRTLVFTTHLESTYCDDTRIVNCIYFRIIS